ncbi:MAG: aldo/keto reductase [Gammaproteobacteria bacterium]|jgi:aryl-alcohol dehydrogenase-like predicted oxidoreductase|nr:aldo/keto reductase [Gammaproteobacteria bacterium]MBT4494035.1 aldo/keto reductase [Gammaproteobacteria bacterium]MBT7371181.1 aldo/keto reductase [Gammaproteobacteria bacterium]
MRLEPKPLGDCGISVSPLSLGTVKLGRNTAVKYPSTFSLPSDEEVISLLEMAREFGINLIDTAPAYGTSEERLGRLLPGLRKDWVICTKAGETFVDGQSIYDFSRSAIESSVRQSLHNLRTDYLDVVLIHSDGRDLEILNETDAMQTLQKLKDEGLVRLIGISTKTVEGGFSALDVSDVLMVTLNLKDQTQLPLIRAAEERGCGILVKKAMASGHGDATANLKFSLSTPGVGSVVLGTINPDHLKQNVETALAL